MIRSAAISKQGKRDYNEDSFLIKKNGNDFIAAVADGLGGQGNGEICSKTAVDAVKELYLKDDDISKSLEECFLGAQEAVMKKKEENIELTRMMTTLVLLRINRDSLAWGHVGDSRLYCFKDKKIVKRTLDHSVPQVLVKTGEIDESEIRHHPDRNRLLRTIGSEWSSSQFQLEEPESYRKNCQFLLCSDGFWEYIEDSDMEKTLNSSFTVSGWLKKMEKIILENGKDSDMDNYTAVAVWI
ncbi:MAG: protein phosphatase 2C domain-containing protein [Lachnospiraceae bacterium]|nr:protein phosphatase 2C domain-containing protein [Lachnospiraceae bacterium]